MKQDEAAGWRVHLGEICRLLSLDFNGSVAYEFSVCACVQQREFSLSFSPSLLFSPPLLYLHISLEFSTLTVLLSNQILKRPFKWNFSASVKQEPHF